MQVISLPETLQMKGVLFPETLQIKVISFLAHIMFFLQLVLDILFKISLKFLKQATPHPVFLLMNMLLILLTILKMFIQCRLSPRQDP